MKNDVSIIREIRIISQQLKGIEIKSDNDGVDRSEDVKSKLLIIETLRWVLK